VPGTFEVCGQAHGEDLDVVSELGVEVVATRANPTLGDGTQAFISA